jgi:quercetin dioxygenase-like cupin family protein
MAYKGQVLRNPITGEVVEFLETAKETRGAYSQFKATLKPGGGFAVEHFHVAGDESFEVLSGTLTYKLYGKQGVVNEGESITLPKGSIHAHWNNHDTYLVMIQTITPSLDIDRFLTALLGLATDNKLDKTGQPPLLQVLVWIRELQSKTYLAAIPKPAQDVLAFLLTPIAKLLGYRAFYEKYEQ